MKDYDAIIIGCGASGTMCALSTKNKNVAIIDCNFLPSKKILVTGNGRCNLTNLNLDSSFYNTNIDAYLNQFNVKQTLAFFEKLGLEWYADEENRVYPITNSAKSVVDVLNKDLKNKVEMFLDETVLNIKKENEKFVVSTNKNIFSCKKLVISTGGNTELFKNLNILSSSFTPSLVALKCSNNLKNLNGVRISNALVTAICENNKKSEMGEVLFKEDGLSGIVIFNLSSIFSRAKNFNGKIVIDMFPSLSLSTLKQKLENRKMLNVPLNKFFVGFLQNSVADEVLKQSKLNGNIDSKELTENEINVLATTLKNLTFNIVGAYSNNQIFSGGVDLSELTLGLESKKVKNLYFTGEVCNVDGVCGGYNLQWAWTSGHIVGKQLWLR